MKTLLLGEMITTDGDNAAVRIQRLHAVLHFQTTDSAMSAGEAYLQDGGDGWCIVENCTEVSFLTERGRP